MQWLIRLLQYSTYGWDKFPTSQEELFVHEATNYRLLRYSTFGWDKFPIPQEELFVHEATNYRLLRYSTFEWDKFPIPQEELFVHEATNYRLPRYLILRRDKFPISTKDLVIQGVTIHRLLLTRFREDTKLLTPRRNPSSSRWRLVDYHSTWPTQNQNLHLSRRNNHPWKQRNNRLLQYSNDLSFSYKGTTRPRDDKKIDYYCTRRNDSRQPMTSFIKKATSQPAVK